MPIDHGRRQCVTSLGALGLASAAMFASRRVDAGDEPRVIAVVARKFEFVPAEIRVKKGETVLLQFTAPEVPMGFSLPDFGLRTDIAPGRGARLKFTPDKAGSFTFLCDLFCGSGHEDMNGTLIVSA